MLLAIDILALYIIYFNFCGVYQKQLLLEGDYLVSKFTGEELKRVRKQAIEAIQIFLNIAGDDKDVPAFQKSLLNLRNAEPN